MARVDVPPTKSNLRKIKDELSFANEGFDLLEQKREILVMEIVKLVNRIKDTEKDLKTALNDLYQNYRISAMEMGSEIIISKGLHEKKRYEVSVESSKLMGIMIPEIKLEGLDICLESGLFGTGVMYDLTKKKSLEVIVLLAKYASVAKSSFLLSRELKKVQRRVNALEKIFIPQYEESKKYITDRLEEMEREEFFIKKMIRELG
ncbi:V-type ATP synthase subunit D [Spirochaetota bacterium]